MFYLIIITFLLITIFLSQLIKLKLVNNKIISFENFILNKVFPISNINEIYKFSILRIIFAIILIYKYFYIFYYLHDNEYLHVYIISILDLIFSIFLLIGFLTQFIIIYFIFFSFQIGELYLSTITLGHDIGAMVLILFFFNKRWK